MCAGHVGQVKTLARIQTQLHWPGIVRDVNDYGRLYHICKKMSERGSVKCEPVQESILCQLPFQKLAIDVVGEIYPAYARGHRFILSIVDVCSRLVEAVTLKYIKSQDVADALMVLWGSFAEWVSPI